MFVCHGRTRVISKEKIVVLAVNIRPQTEIYISNVYFITLYNNKIYMSVTRHHHIK